MAKIHTPKSRPKAAKDKPSCATCFHFEPDQQAENIGLCLGVLPKALMRMDGQAVGAFPSVRATHRCPNWRTV